LKRLYIAIIGVFGLGLVLAGQGLDVRIDGQRLRIGAPRLRFMVGDALVRLRDGATVQYEFQLTARTAKDGKVLARSLERFAVSYDLWEEKFAVKKLGSEPKAISHLSAAAVEAWCLDNTSLPTAVVGSQSFWLRLDYEAVVASNGTETPEDSGFTLTGLVDIFSRRTRTEQPRGSAEVGPLRLETLKKR
jgi:hypothetical protein